MTADVQQNNGLQLQRYSGHQGEAVNSLQQVHQQVQPCHWFCHARSLQHRTAGAGAVQHLRATGSGWVMVVGGVLR